MRAIERITIPAVAAVALLGGCGSGDETIPQDSGDELLNRLTALEDSVEDGECALARQHAQGFVNEVDSLPNEVEGKVERALREAADQLVALASDPDECGDTGATGETGPSDEEPETTEQTTTTTTTEDEPPADEEEEEPAEPEEAEPEAPSEGEGEGRPSDAGPPDGAPSDGDGDDNSSGGGISAPRRGGGGGG